MISPGQIQTETQSITGNSECIACIIGAVAMAAVLILAVLVCWIYSQSKQYDGQTVAGRQEMRDEGIINILILAGLELRPEVKPMYVARRKK